MREWHHLILGGPASATHAFVAGVLADRGIDVPLFWGGALGLEPHSIGERLRDFLLRDHHEELFAPADVAAMVATAIAAGGADADVRITGRQVVRAVAFDWSAETPSHEAAARIRTALIEPLPTGVVASAVQQSEFTDPSAAGIEGYKPVHDFEWTASGRISGVTPAVLALYADVRTMDFVRVSALDLELIPG